MNKVGDILEVTLSKGSAYIRFAGRERPSIHILEVLDAPIDASPTPLSLAEAAVKFAFLSNVGILKKHGAFRYVGSAPNKERRTYKFRTRTFGGWVIDDRFIPKLTREEAALPIWEGVPGDEIVKRLESGWVPEMDTLDIEADIKRYATSRRDPVGLAVFVRFANKAVAERAAGVLVLAGYKVENRGRRLEVKVAQEMPAINSSAIEAEEGKILEICAPFEPFYEGNEIG